MAYQYGYGTGYTDTVQLVATPVIEFAPMTDPGSETPTWVDITADWRQNQPARTRRGKNQELDQYRAGTATVTLDNRDRAYDDTYEDSPYYPNVTPMRRFRIRADYAGTTYPVFDGFVDQWDLQYGNPDEAFAQVDATDGFKVLAASQLASSPYVQEVLADGPVHWWRLDDPADTNIVLDSVGNYHLTGFDGTPEFGVEGIVSREPATAMLIDDNDEGVYMVEKRPPVVAGPPVTIEMVLTADGTSGVVFSNVYYGSTGFQDELVVRFNGSNGEVDWAVWRNGSGTLAQSTTTSLAIGDRIHLACVWDASGAQKIYRNGVDVTVGTPSVTAGTFAPTFFDELSIGAIALSATSAYWGKYQYVAVYDQALSAARIAAHAATVSEPWDGDTPAQRADRVADAIGWPDASRDFDTNTGSTLQAADLGETTALDHLRKVAASEFGDVYITRDGVLRLVSRASLADEDPAGTFDDSGSGAGYSVIGWSNSDQHIRNDVTVSRVEGIAQRVEDTASIGTYLRHSYTIDGLIHDDDELSRDAAEFIVSEYKDPKRRITNLLIRPASNPLVLWPLVLGLELGDVLTVEFSPPGGGDPISQNVRVEGISHSFTGQWWDVTLSLSPRFTSSGSGGAIGQWDMSNWDESRWFF